MILAIVPDFGRFQSSVVLEQAVFQRSSRDSRFSGICRLVYTTSRLEGKTCVREDLGLGCCLWLYSTPIFLIPSLPVVLLDSRRSPLAPLFCIRAVHGNKRTVKFLLLRSTPLREIPCSFRASLIFIQCRLPSRRAKPLHPRSPFT